MASFEKRLRHARTFCINDRSTIDYVQRKLYPELVNCDEENKALLKMLEFAKVNPSIELCNRMTKVRIALRLCKARLKKVLGKNEISELYIGQ